MAKTRDSGICFDNDSDSLSSVTSTQLSYVQRLKKRFECLAKEQEFEFHSECNWWLDEEAQKPDNLVEIEEKGDEETKEINDGRNEVSVEVETKSYSKQSSIKSQISRESSKGETLLIITPATPVISPLSPKEYPTVTFTDYQGAQETNDSDSFESDDGEDDEVMADDELQPDEQYFKRFDNKLRLSRPISISSQASNVSSKLNNIVHELLENEENYVRSLSFGIKNYMSVFDRKEIPKTLRGQKHRIFANIKSIYNLHQEEFLPALLKCDDDPEKIAACFTDFVTTDNSYAYIIYAINRKHSEQLCSYDVEFWKKIQNEVADRLGINNFLLQPIQRLPRYQMLISEMIKDMSKDLCEENKGMLRACCLAEKNIQRLIMTVNESMSINDIRNCYEIDVLDQGKFKKMDEFDIYDWELRRRFRGKVFLFERGVVYTESLNKEYLEFRGDIRSDVLGIDYKEGKTKFKLFAKRRGQNEVEFRASLKIVIEWSELIKGILMKFVEEEKKKNARKKNSVISLRPHPERNSVRDSVVSNKSDHSIYSMSSYRSSSGNSSMGHESFDPRKSKWYI